MRPRLLGDGVGCCDGAFAPIDREENLHRSARSRRRNGSHDFHRARGGAQNALGDASEKKTSDGAVTVRANENQVRTPLLGETGDFGSRMSRAGLGKRLVACAGKLLGSLLHQTLAFPRRVFAQSGKPFKALQIDDIQDAKRRVGGPYALHDRVEERFG